MNNPPTVQCGCSRNLSELQNARFQLCLQQATGFRLGIFCGRVSATETVDSGLIPGGVKPRTKNWYYSFTAFLRDI